MTRKTVILVTGGVIAAFAIAGTAIGASAAGLGPTRLNPVTAITTGDQRTGPPDVGGPESGSTSATGGAPVSATSGPPAGPWSLGHERAIEIALAEAGGGAVREIERDWEHGRPVWSIEIINGRSEIEVDVDAETGAVVKIERERADDDRGDWDDDRNDRDDDRNDRDDDRNDWDDD